MLGIVVGALPESGLTDCDPALRHDLIAGRSPWWYFGP